MHRSGTILELSITALLAGAPNASAQVPSFHLVGVPSGAVTSEVRGLSADGRIAAGYSNPPSGFAGFTWTEAMGRSDFGLLPGMPATTQTYGISGDGTTVVGSASTANGRRAFRWDGSGTVEILGVLPGYPRSYAEGASGDGSVVVGRSQSTDGNARQAFRWSAGSGMQGLGFTQVNGFYSDAAGVSRDGNTIVGISGDFNGEDAFIYTQAGGMHALPQLPGTPFPESYATAVNFDGSIVVGVSGAVGSGVIWRNGQISDLGVPAGWVRSIMHAVNDDGTIVAGYLFSNLTQAAAVWTPGRGMEPLLDYLVANGVPVPPDSLLFDCFAVSSDGRTFAGRGGFAGIGDSGWVASVPVPAAMPIVVLIASVAGLRRRRG